MFVNYFFWLNCQNCLFGFACGRLLPWESELYSATGRGGPVGHWEELGYQRNTQEKWL